MTMGHIKAQKLYPLKICVVCKTARAVERHHIDGNEFNNKSDNVVVCCRRCHMEIDGRIKQAIIRAHIINNNKRQYTPKHCKTCNKPIVPGKVKNSRCKTCDTYWRRNGEERPFKDKDGRTVTVGEQNASSKLTEDDVRYIRTSNKTTAELARKFNVAWHSVNKVRQGLRWRHVS